MTRKQWFYHIPGAFLLLGFFFSAHAEYDIGEEIARVRRELNQVQSERKRVKEETTKDRKEFTDYVQRRQKQFNEIQRETDTIQAQVQHHAVTRDSLAGELEGVLAGKRQYDLLQDAFRKHLIAGCDRFLEITAQLPPMAAKNLSSSITYLKSELSGNTIDNTEGINRLTQIMNDINENTATIQIMQGRAPVTEIRGTCYRLRIGAVFEAAVDAKGMTAALWTGYDGKGEPVWNVIEEQAVAANILRAVNIREGKEIPEFVALPYGTTPHTPVPDTGGEQ